MATQNSVNTGLSGSSGTGNFAGTTSPTFVTPTLGDALATSVNFGGNSLGIYVKGTLTPTISADTVGDLSVVYTNQTTVYTKIGRIVNIKCRCSFTPTYTTASGSIRILGLPSAPTGEDDGGVVTLITSCTWPVGRTSLSVYFGGGNSSYAQIYCSGSAVAPALLQITGFTSGVASTIEYTGTYQTTTG